VPTVIEQTMDAHTAHDVSTLEEVRELDRWARRYSQNVARGLELKV
jgi:1-deoxy-D-xylulose 5-phosphate reductoisomerase